MPVKICPQCGKEFKTSANKVICCSTECRYAMQRQREIRICKQCGKEFEARINSSRMFCSKPCSGAYHGSASNKITKACKHCGEMFTSWTYRNQQYCSRECKQTHVARKNRPSRRLKRQTVDLNCEWCNKPYTVHVSQNSNGRTSRFCSAECRYNWMSVNQRGINHPNYIGGTKYSDRGTNWTKQRNATLKRDNYTCQICGKKRKPGQKRIVEVHHIVPFKNFSGDYVAANQLSNLITLCRHCHVLVEDYNYPCPVRLL